MPRISETRQRQLATIREYNQQRQQYKEDQIYTKRAQAAWEVGRFYDRRSERTYELGARIPAADPNESVPRGVKRKAEVAEETTHQHKKLKTNTLEMSPSRETKEHLESIKVRRGEGQQYQGTARQGESRKGLEGKPKNPYASLKAAKRGQTSKIAAPKIRIPRVMKSIEGGEDTSKNEAVAKKTTVVKEAPKPSRKRKAAEDLEDVAAAVKDVAKEATSTIYIKREADVEAKAEGVAEIKPAEIKAAMSSGKKRKAADALEDDTAQAVVRGEDAPSAKKRRGEDWPKMGPLEEKKKVPSGEKKAKTVKADEAPSPSGPVASPAKLATPKPPTKRMPWMNRTSAWGRSSVITRETVTVKNSPAKGGSSGRSRR